MDLPVRTHGIARSIALAVLVTMPIALGNAGAASAGAAMAAEDVVVNVTAGANDPVSGAAVVARDDRTGRVVSNTTTTGDLGYTVIRLRPGAPTQRVTITATGGRSQAVGRLSAADVMSATAPRRAIAAAIEQNVNPGSTVLAEYLDVRPGASIAAAQRAVARRLRLPSGADVAEAARFARSRFSGEDFIDAARARGGVQAYSEWAAGRMGTGAGVRSFAAPRPADDLPLRATTVPSSSSARLRNEHNVGAGLLFTLVKPLIELGAKKAYCYLGLKDLCDSTAPAPTSGLSEAEKKQLGNIERGISDLSTQMTTAQQALSAIDVQVAALGGQVAALNYGAEMNAVQDVISATRAAAGLRAEGKTVPPDLSQALTNALVRRYEINSGCPNWAALVGTLPPAAVMDGSEPRYPSAACTSLAQGIATNAGLMQFAQRRVASAYSVVTAGTTQAAVDSAGEFWLGEFAKNVFASSAASAYALRPGGNSTRSAEVVEATEQLFNDAVALIEVDATGLYFGARIPSDQVLKMGPSSGTIYGIGNYEIDPGRCFGNGTGFMAWKRNRAGDPLAHSSFFPTYGGGGIKAPAPFPRADAPDVASPPVMSGACAPGKVVAPPPDIPGAPQDSWASPDTVPAAQLTDVLAPLRRAALCHMKDRVDSGASLGARSGDAAGGLCDPYPVAIPDEPFLAWTETDPLTNRVRKTNRGVLPNLQLSLRNSACHPWMVGFTNDENQAGKPRGWETPEYRLTTASGMQCPVIDLTPRAAARYGWNCVKASPAGRIYFNGAPASARGPRAVTASLEILNNPTMGGYCPSLGARPAPSGAANVSYMVDQAKVYNEGRSSRGLGQIGRKICSPAFMGLFDVDGDSEYQCAMDRYEGADAWLSPQPRGGLLLWPLQRQIHALTSYTGGLIGGADRVPGYKSEDWTYNNDVAGDFVVGPLYTSNAVGAYVPGTSPGGPASSAPSRVAGARVPGPVADLSVCGQDCTGDTTSLRVEWRPPASSGGLTITRYEVVGTTTGNLPRTTRSCVPPSIAAMQCTFRNIDVSAGWEFRVLATNALGKGAATTMTFTPGPGRPVLRPLTDALEVRWSTPQGQEWDTNRYTATATPGGRACRVAGFRSTTCTITGLAPGTAYTVTVVLTREYFCYAKMPCGRDDSSLPSAPATPLGAPARPDAPDLDSAVPAAGRIAVKWRAPAGDGNSPIAGYTATAMPGGATCTTLGSLSCDIDGLAPGIEYSVSVTATNGVGTGPASPALRRTTPVLVPGPPRTPLAQTASGSIEVSWVAPDFDGGTAITGYTATASPGGAQCTTDGATTCTISGLAHNTEYEVTVTAMNEAGTGRASVPAAARTPNITVPGAPQPPVLTSLPGRIEVGWAAPESDGGTAVTGYIATATPGGATCSTTGATLCTITGLDNGTTYRVVVAAINAMGTGASSDASEGVTPHRDDDAAPLFEAGFQPVAIPGSEPPPAPVDASGGASASGSPLALAGVALTPRTLVPGLGSRIAYSLSASADVTITFARVGARDRRSRVVHRIPAGRPGALAGATRIRLLYSRASARRKVAGAWTMTIEARGAQGGVARTTIPIRVRT